MQPRTFEKGGATVGQVAEAHLLERTAALRVQDAYLRLHRWFAAEQLHLPDAQTAVAWVLLEHARAGEETGGELANQLVYHLV
jgi:hypothetical protein